MAAVEQLYDLLRYCTLSPLTSKPEEWIDRTEMSGYPMWQNLRDTAAMSYDAGLTWTFVDDRSENQKSPDQPS